MSETPPIPAATLVVVRDRVAKLVRSGKTQEQVLEARPTREFEEKYGGASFNAALRPASPMPRMSPW